MSRSSNATKPVSDSPADSAGSGLAVQDQKTAAVATLEAPEPSSRSGDREPPRQVKPVGDTDPQTGVVSLPVPDLVKEFSAPTRRYWIGTLGNCPMQNVTAGGVCFPRFLGNPEFDDKGQPDRPLQLGAEVELTDEECEAVKHGVMRRVLRSFGGKRSKMLVTDGKTYRAQVGDVPLGRYLYMVDLTATRGVRPAETKPLMA